jgi:antitoxin HicB
MENGCERRAKKGKAMAKNQIVSKSEILAKQYLAKPYARLVIPEEDGSFRGEIVEFSGCISTGNTAAEAIEKLELVAKSWLISALDLNQSIPNPVESSNDFSGKLVLRFPKSLHKKAAWFAELEKVSLNQFIVTSIAVALGEKQTVHAVGKMVTLQQPQIHFQTNNFVNQAAFVQANPNNIFAMPPIQTKSVKTNA